MVDHTGPDDSREPGSGRCCKKAQVAWQVECESTTHFHTYVYMYHVQ